jgi:hypothetical protein
MFSASALSGCTRSSSLGEETCEITATFWLSPLKISGPSMKRGLMRAVAEKSNENTNES